MHHSIDFYNGQINFVILLDILWFHNSKALENSENVVINTNVEEMKASCTILNVTKEHTGTYMCKAVNDVSQDVTKAKLDLASASATATSSAAIGRTTNVTETMSSSMQTSQTSEIKESKMVSESSHTKSEKKMKSNKKIARTQKSTKEGNKTEMRVAQVQQMSEEEIESDEAQIDAKPSHQAHLEVTRDNTHAERISDASSIEVSAKNQHYESEDVEILEETEEIHVKIYKEVFSSEELENFKVADEVNVILESIEAHQFGSGERPLREIATVAHLLKRGVEISEIIQLYDNDFFPALKLPESQSALVQLVERQGYENLIAEILNDSSTEDETLLASTVGFRAFMRMVEVTKVAIEEIITNFKFEDFVSQEWKHKEIRDSEVVEVTESRVSTVRAEKISVTGNESD